MKIGFIVDGKAEFASFPIFLRKIETPCSLGKVLHADVHPLSPLPHLIRILMISVAALVKQRQVERVVVIMDREGRNDCAGVLAAELAGALAGQCGREGLSVSIQVVIKDRMFENWLVADLDALRAMPARFDISPAFESKVSPDRADAVDAFKLLNGVALKTGFDKVKDAQRILDKADPLRMAANSRSFRRFLRVVGVERYAEQSRRP